MTKRSANFHVVSLAAMLATLVATGAAGAQGLTALRQLDGRASPSLRAQVETVADSLVRAGLPAEPVVDKALEGVSKGADDQRIMVAVRGVASDLRIAERALGASSDQELTAAIAALRAGSSASSLGELRRQLPGRSLVVPLSVLASLLVDGAPASNAVMAVVANTRMRNDANLLAYGQAVSRDIAHGVTPLAAITTTDVGRTSLDAARPATLNSMPSSGPTKPKPRP